VDELRTEEQAMASLHEQLVEQTHTVQSATDEAAALRIQLEEQLLEEKRKVERANNDMANAKQRMVQKAKKMIKSYEKQLSEATTKSEVTHEALETHKGLLLILQAELSQTKKLAETQVSVITQKAKSAMKEVSSLRNKLAKLKESQISALALKDHIHSESASAKKIITSSENQLAEGTTKSEATEGIVLELQAELSKTKKVAETQVSVLKQKAKSALKEVSSLRNELSKLNESQSSWPALKDHFHSESASAKKMITSLESVITEATTESEVTREALEAQKGLILKLQAELSNTKKEADTQVSVLKQEALNESFSENLMLQTERDDFLGLSTMHQMTINNLKKELVRVKASVSRSTAVTGAEIIKLRWSIDDLHSKNRALQEEKLMIQTQREDFLFLSNMHHRTPDELLSPRQISEDDELKENKIRVADLQSALVSPKKAIEWYRDL
jgi:hypothetical protein